ncbi:MAG TPA: glutaredoxin domain-containing protein [Dehalococcoidia bacterium]
MAQPKVVIFVRPDCPACREAMAFFAEHHVPYDDRDVEFDPAALREMLQHDARETPTIVIDGEVIEGFDRHRLETILEDYGIP